MNLKKRKEALLEDYLEGDTSEGAEKVRAALQEAESHNEAGRYSEAQQVLDSLRDSDATLEPGTWRALMTKIAELHLLAGSPKRCKEILKNLEEQGAEESFRRKLLWAQATADSGNYEAAVELTQALEADPEDVGEQFEKKSLLLRLSAEQGFFEAAYNSGLQLVVETENLFGVPSREHLRAVSLLAWAASRTERHTEALALAEGAVAEAAAVVNTSDPEFLEAGNNLARFAHRGGDLERAVKLGRELLETRKSLLGEKHHKTLVSADNLVAYLEELGEVDEALAISEDVVESWSKTYGLKHPKALAPQVRLIALKAKTGQGDEVAEQSLEVLQAHEERLGAEHVKTLEAAKAAADCIVAGERWELKEAVLEFLQRAEAADASPEVLEELHQRLKGQPKNL